MTCMLSAEAADKLVQGLTAAADQSVKPLPPTVTLSDDETHIKILGTLQTEIIANAKVFVSANLNTGVPTFTPFITADKQDFAKPPFAGGTTPQARAVESVHALAGVGGSIFTLLTDGGALKAMHSKLPKGEGKTFKQMLKGDVCKTLEEDCTRAMQAGEAPKNTWSPPVKFRKIYDKEGDVEIDEKVQWKLPPTPLFVECTDEKTAEEIKADEAMFHPDSELLAWQKAHPNWRPTDKLKVVCADGQPGHWTDMFKNTPYNSITIVAQFEVAPWKVFLSTKHSTDRIVITFYLRAVKMFGHVGKKRAADADAGPALNTAQQMVLDQFYDEPAAKKQRTEDGGGASDGETYECN